MKTYIVYAHDSKFTVHADGMETFNGIFEFERRRTREDGTIHDENIFVITSFGYAHAEDAEFTVEDARAL